MSLSRLPAACAALLARPVAICVIYRRWLILFSHHLETPATLDACSMCTSLVSLYSSHLIMMQLHPPVANIHALCLKLPTML